MPKGPYTQRRDDIAHVWQLKAEAIIRFFDNLGMTTEAKVEYLVNEFCAIQMRFEHEAILKQTFGASRDMFSETNETCTERKVLDRTEPALFCVCSHRAWAHLDWKYECQVTGCNCGLVRPLGYF